MAGIYILHSEADTQWAFLQAATSTMHSIPFSLATTANVYIAFSKAGLLLTGN